jgi:hypothetical protein
VPLTSVRQLVFVGDPIGNGAAIGAAIGGGTALAMMAKACSNSGCADTTASLDPRITLLGMLAGAGIGALVDAAVDARKTVYPKPAALPASTGPQPAARMPGTVFVRFGWAGLSDDEGSLGSGATVGGGVVVPFGRRFGIQLAYDRHDHRRDFEDAAPPGISAGGGGFTGTEQLVTAKALMFFRPDKAARPYAGLGVGLFDSKRASEFPSYLMQPGGGIVAGAPQIYRYDTRGFALGFAAGVDARVAKRFSIVSDLTLDIGPDALGSARLTVGAGWHF